MANNFAIDEASKIMLDVYNSVTSDIASGDIDVISELVVALDHMKREVSELLESVKDKMADMMGESPEYSTNGFFFEKKMGSSRKAWDHKSLSQVVAKRLVESSVDLDTGEILKSPSEMIEEAFAFAGVSYWRIKELQRIGVNADSFCEVSEGKPSIIVRTGK